MNNFIISALLGLFLSLGANSAGAQAWKKHTNVLSLGVGISRFAHIDDYYYLNTNNNKTWYSTETGQFNVQVEFGVHKYVGVGFTTGFGARVDRSPTDYPGEINLPIGLITNFHFYQLIADKSRKKIRGDKLDIYAGGSLGSGIAASYYTNSTRIVPLAFAGLHAGVRYYFTNKIGLNAELGFGKSILNAGFSFKI